MADLRVKSLGLKNPFIVASSPATHGLKGVLKSAQGHPGAIVMRNFGHGAGGGSIILPAGANMLGGQACVQSHALGASLPDKYARFEDFVEDVARTRDQLDPTIRLWVSVGYLLDIGHEWREKWVAEAIAFEKAGADAVELHLNSPGVAYVADEYEGFYEIVSQGTQRVRDAVKIPVMCKLPVEGCDPFTAMQAALNAGADAVGPTARWRGMLLSLDYQYGASYGGAGYGASQSLPIISYVAAEARRRGIKAPMFAGGGVYHAEAAAKLLLAGSDAVQLGSLACCLGPRAVAQVIESFEKLMEEQGYDTMEDICGKASFLVDAHAANTQARSRALGAAYKARMVDADKCVGCGRCVDACWYDGMVMNGRIAQKTAQCVGCGYCFSVCPSAALQIDVKEALAPVL